MKQNYEKVINVNKMQHQYIQNLQKANLFLKAKLKDVQEASQSQGSVDTSHIKLLADDNKKEDLEEYKMVSVGPIESLSKQELMEKKAGPRYDYPQTDRSHHNNGNFFEQKPSMNREF